jgi:hypothetical protein
MRISEVAKRSQILTSALAIMKRLASFLRRAA